MNTLLLNKLMNIPVKALHPWDLLLLCVALRREKEVEEKPRHGTPMGTEVPHDASLRRFPFA